MHLTLEMFENAIEVLKEQREPLPFIMPRSDYEVGVKLYGKEAMEDALKRWNTKVIDRM